METKINTIPKPDTFPDLLLTLTALSGEFPSALVDRLPGSGYYHRNMVTRMKKDGLLYKYSRDGLHGLRLTAQAKQLLLARQPDRYGDILSGDTAVNAPKYEVPYRLRLHRMAEAMVTMMNAGVTVFPWEKPAIFQTEDGELGIWFDRPAYYTSFEVKGMEEERNKVIGSRATGVLLGGSRLFAVYNTGDSELKWESRSEERLTVLLKTELRNMRLASQYFDSRNEAIMFASDTDLLEAMMGDDRAARRKGPALDDTYEHFHYLTNDHHGETILWFLCNDALKAAMDNLLMEDLSPNPYFTECDGFDADGTPVLFGYTCDMPRIRRFITSPALIGQTKKGMLICFDFQESALRRVCGRHISFMCIDFDMVEKHIFSVFQSPPSRQLYHNYTTA